MTRALAAAALCLLALVRMGPAWSHGQSTALVQVVIPAGATPRSTLRIDLALVDLELALGLDGDGDGAITWRELQSRGTALAAYVEQRVSVSAGAAATHRACPLAGPHLQVDEHADGAYAVLSYELDCLSASEPVVLEYHLLFEQNPSHRALATLQVAGEVRSTEVLSRDSPSVSWTRTDGFFAGFSGWIGEGTWHIWTGLDHLLFLATLLLAAGTLPQVIRIVSAFTLSHSLTLVAGALGWIHFPSRWIEAAIACTVLVGALNLVLPFARRRLWLLALGFGLIHGLGFASVLAGMELDGAHLVRNLLGFNLGVEIGQLVVVFLLVPLIRALHQRVWYRRAFAPGAATAIGVVAVVWIAQRLA